MTAGRVSLKIVADRLGLARRYHEDLPRPPSSVE
jgi:hypothetical protein